MKLSDLDCIIKDLPPICKSTDLMRVGIFKDKFEACRARSKKVGPEFFYLPNRGVVYSRDAVIRYLIKHAETEPSKCDQIRLRGTKKALLTPVTHKSFRDHRGYVCQIPICETIRCIGMLGDSYYIFFRDNYIELMPCSTCKKNLPSAQFGLDGAPCLDCRSKLTQNFNNPLSRSDNILTRDAEEHSIQVENCCRRILSDDMDDSIENAD